MSNVSSDRYSALIRHGTFAGHDAGPDDYDRVLAELAEVRAWALNHDYDRVAALAAGMVTAILVIDPRQRPAY
jgi:hypothetical protein